MTICKASQQDINALMDLDTGFSDETGCSPYDQHQWLTYMNCEHIFLYMGDDGPLGFLLAIENSDKTLQLERFFVTKETRGEGIGTALIEEFNTLQNTYLCKAFLHVAQENQDALEIYERFGFKTVDTYNGIMEMCREKEFLTL